MQFTYFDQHFINTLWIDNMLINVLTINKVLLKTCQWSLNTCFTSGAIVCGIAPILVRY